VNPGGIARVKSLFTVGVLLALSVVAAGCGGAEEATPTQAPAATATPTQSADVAKPAGEVVNVQLTENPYAFNPADLTFEVGKTYSLSFQEPGEFHTFTIAELGIDIFINAGESVNNPVTFDQVGTFKLICVPHEATGMVGTITVQ
jgi:plastocyanin